jgi:hypothetical protein
MTLFRLPQALVLSHDVRSRCRDVLAGFYKQAGGIFVPGGIEAASGVAGR